VVISLRDIGGRAPISNATHSWTSRRGIRVELEIDGIVGVGECSPLPGVSRESLDDVRAELSSLSGVASIEAIRSKQLSSSARFAIDTALLDRRARSNNTSIAALLCGQEPRDVRASALLGDPCDRKSPHEVIRCAKLKVGPAAAWSEQAAAIDALVAAHPDLVLRLDFNESLALTDARAVVADIAGRDWPIDFVEDPSTDAVDGPRGLAVAIDTPALLRIGVDQVQALAAADRLDVAVLKPALLGGLVATFALAEALSPELDVVVSHLLDGPIALQACAELACAVATLRDSDRAAGVGPHDALHAYGAVDAFENAWLRPAVGGLMIAR